MRKIIDNGKDVAETSRLLTITNSTVKGKELKTVVLLKQSMLDRNSFAIACLETQLIRLYTKRIKDNEGNYTGEEQETQAKMLFKLALSEYPYSDRSPNEVSLSFKREKIHAYPIKVDTNISTITNEFRLPEQGIWYVDIFCAPFKISDKPIFLGQWYSEQGELVEYKPQVKEVKVKAIKQPSQNSTEAVREFLKQFSKAAERQ